MRQTDKHWPWQAFGNQTKLAVFPSLHKAGNTTGLVFFCQTITWNPPIPGFSVIDMVYVLEAQVHINKNYKSKMISTHGTRQLLRCFILIIILVATAATNIKLNFVTDYR